VKLKEAEMPDQPVDPDATPEDAAAAAERAARQAANDDDAEDEGG